MKLILFELIDYGLDIVFFFALIITFHVTTENAKKVLRPLSLQARSRFPFGLAGLLLAGCAMASAHWVFRQIFLAYSSMLLASTSPLTMVERLIAAYGAYLVFTALLAGPAVALGTIWWSFRRADAERILARCSNAVLLLHSFEGDETERGPSRDVERALEKALRSTVGPFVALGSPDDFRPPSGARRTYVNETEWRRKVTEYLERSSAVVFILSRWSPSVQWEIELLQARFRPERTVLIIPPGTGAIHSTFRTDSLSMLLANLRVRPDSTDAQSASGRGGTTGGVVLGYAADWSPVVLKRDLQTAHDLAEAAVAQFLAPNLS